jgi:NAD-reducing hydrogenase small subunit
MAKPKYQPVDLRLCRCHMSLLDMDERILAVAELTDIRATPITDLKEPDESGVEVGVLEGGINNSANEEVAIRMRKRCKTLVALGDCAIFGGVPAMRNFFTIEETLRRAYVETESTDSEGKIPSDPELATMTNLRAVQEVVPGLPCPLSSRRGCDFHVSASWPRAANLSSKVTCCIGVRVFTMVAEKLLLNP